MFTRNATEVIEKALREMFNELNAGNFRGNTIDLRDVTLYFNPNEPYLDYGKTRPANRDYIHNELDWYMSQDLCIEGHKGIEDNKIWQRVATESGRVNGNYGNLVFSKGNGFQYDHALKALKENRYTRQSVMIYNRPEMHVHSCDGYHAKADFTCTMYVHCFIENDNTFNYYVYMRSNDVIFGLQNDYTWHHFVYHKMYYELKSLYPELKTGKIVWHAGSLHIYERHYELLKNIMEEYNYGEV